MKNHRPIDYRGPRTVLERRVMKWLMPRLIGSHRVLVDYADNMELDALPDDCIAVLAPPSLGGALKILCSPTFQPGETFRRGEWYLKKGEVSEFIEELYVDQTRLFYKFFHFAANFRGLSFYLKQHVFTKFFTRKVHKHYDCDSDLYQAFLDEEMVYTCGFFEQQKDTLSQAQSRKLELVIERLQLPAENAQVLEIGCGWGALPRRLITTNESATYIGLTISKGQFDRAKILDTQRLRPEQKQRITYRLEDYLDHHPDNHDGYDGIAVIGMMEHVGLKHHDIFLEKICSLLKPGRRAVIHTIIAGKSDEPTNSWIDKYIFHGGYAPSMAEVVKATEKCTCKVETVFTHAPENYRRTIEEWCANLERNWPRYRSENLGTWSNRKADELYRIWYFYLSAVRNMFVPGTMDFQVAHFVIKKPYNSLKSNEDSITTNMQ